ncbi:MAG: FHIPEP family type III secretion protein, partial [Leptospiraceae bacterium]|nr:FHIPEP family type III secretion protein [Leptospiraceae bacterium]
GYTIDRNTKETLATIEKKEIESKGEKKIDYYKELRTDPIEVELGLNLVPLVDANYGGVLLDRIQNVRRKFAIDIGLVIPPVRIMDNMELDHDFYAIKIHGVIVGESKVRSDKLMALDNAKKVQDPIAGEEFIEPTYGFKALWIDPSDKLDAESRGYSVVDPATVIVTHLTELIRNHAASILGREEVKKLLDHQKETHPTLVSELEDKKISLGIIQQVLQNFLKEGLGIRNLTPILESIANNTTGRNDPNFLSENARQAISNQIVKEYLSSDGKLHVIALDAKITDRLTKSLVSDPIEGVLISLPPDYHFKLINAITDRYHLSQKEGRFPIIVVSRDLRLPFSYMLAKEFPPRNFAVLAAEEIHTITKSVIDAVITLTTEPAKQVAVPVEELM